jgi:hypothetical protein
MISKGYKQNKIKNWKQFRKKVRNNNGPLLSCLKNFPCSVLVTGCQRSGTTMLSRIITQSKGMTDFWFSKDEELDAALILSGNIKINRTGRYCFQTTYLNECYDEYFNNKEDGHKIIWVLRNPNSVVYSLLYNWKRWALNELFEYCGVHFLNEQDMSRYKKFGRWGVSLAKRACISYNAKLLQLREIITVMGTNSVMVIDYENLVKNPIDLLPPIYQFIDLEFDKKYANQIHSRSLNKKKKLPEKIQRMVNAICEPVYQDARGLFK